MYSGTLVVHHYLRSCGKGGGCAPVIDAKKINFNYTYLEATSIWA